MRDNNSRSQFFKKYYRFFRPIVFKNSSTFLLKQLFHIFLFQLKNNHKNDANAKKETKAEAEAVEERVNVRPFIINLTHHYHSWNYYLIFME